MSVGRIISTLRAAKICMFFGFIKPSYHSTQNEILEWILCSWCLRVNNINCFFAWKFSLDSLKLRGRSVCVCAAHFTIKSPDTKQSLRPGDETWMLLCDTNNTSVTIRSLHGLLSLEKPLKGFQLGSYIWCVGLFTLDIAVSFFWLFAGSLSSHPTSHALLSKD